MHSLLSTYEEYSQKSCNLKKTNYNLFNHFSQFMDLIDIQNDNFCQEMREFRPKQLIVSVLTETKNLFDYNPYLEFGKLSASLLGDEARIQYITIFLIKNAIKRNE